MSILGSKFGGNSSEGKKPAKSTGKLKANQQI